MGNPAGYLYRVGQSSVRRLRRRRPPALRDAAPEPVSVEPEPGLGPALALLTDHQRAAVVLLHGFGWPAGEVAAVLDISATTVRTHAERGLAKLRAALEVDVDA
jgi:DNA-directed RNA polymerase specialized sigma24 family protein